MSGKKIGDRLTKAINLLGEYAIKHLPEGYEIRLTFRKEEAFFELHADADFEAVDLPSIHDSQFIEACASAQNHKKEMG